MISNSNIYRFNGKDPFDNWTEKDGVLKGYYPRNSLINLLSKSESAIGVYPNYCVIRGNVKSIGRSTFRNNKRFGLIVISEGVETIEEYAFLNASIKEIGLPHSIKKINKNAFSKNITLFVYKDSYAEKYAIRNGFKYEYYQIKN